MRKSLHDLYALNEWNVAFQHLRDRTCFVPGEGCELFPWAMFVGEAPGADEERQRRPFVGRSGDLLRKMLAGAGIDVRECFITNLVKFRPPGNRPPTPEEADAGRRFLLREMAIVMPDVVVPLGRHALQACLPDEQRGITTLQGTLVDAGKRTYYPLLHPSAVLRGGLPISKYQEQFRTLRELLG